MALKLIDGTAARFRRQVSDFKQRAPSPFRNRDSFERSVAGSMDILGGDFSFAFRFSYYGNNLFDGDHLVERFSELADDAERGLAGIVPVSAFLFNRRGFRCVLGNENIDFSDEQIMGMGETAYPLSGLGPAASLIIAPFASNREAIGVGSRVVGSLILFKEKKPAFDSFDLVLSALMARTLEECCLELNLGWIPI